MHQDPDIALGQACIEHDKAMEIFASLHKALSVQASWAQNGIGFQVFPIEGNGHWFDVLIVDLRLRIALSLTVDLKGVITAYRLPSFGGGQVEALERATFDCDSGKLEGWTVQGPDIYLTSSALARRFGLQLLLAAVQRPRPLEGNSPALIFQTRQN